MAFFYVRRVHCTKHRQIISPRPRPRATTVPPTQQTWTFKAQNRAMPCFTWCPRASLLALFLLARVVLSLVFRAALSTWRSNRPNGATQQQIRARSRTDDENTRMHVSFVRTPRCTKVNYTCATLPPCLPRRIANTSPLFHQRPTTGYINHPTCTRERLHPRRIIKADYRLIVPPYTTPSTHREGRQSLNCSPICYILDAP